MNEEIKNALKQDRTIDITTKGKKSGEPRRIEIWFHNIDGRIYITGTPGTRGWYANMIANPDFTFHLTRTAQPDIPS
ncbi:MAG: nitroreductase family deazaflavin-dependent oxidoreductase, partial [Chloroflexi bacterium]|nr:nitroreductase family deazaflavin-dependent oxidoreductase [Chloroflexota bacterium]